MEKKTKNDPSGVGLEIEETPKERPKMRYFRRMTEIQSLKSQRVKSRRLEKIFISHNEILEGSSFETESIKDDYFEVESEKVDWLISFLKSQKPNMKSLKALTVPVANDNTSGICQAVSTVIQRNQKHLKYLCLKFLGDEVSPKGIKVLAPKIANNFKRLRQLHLFFDTGVSVREWSLNLRMINQIETVKELSIYSLRNQLCDKKLKKLAARISANPQLQKLDFTISEVSDNHQLTNKGVEALAKQIGTNLKQIQDLSLGFSRVPYLSCKGIKTLAEQIGMNLTKLQKLSLDFFGCSNIKKNGINFLANKIGSHMRLLRTLSLNFVYNKNLTDKELANLAIQIGENLEGIQELRLDFSGCIKITDEGVKNLAVQIGTNMTKLKHLTLGYHGCDQITNNGFKKLITEIGDNLKQLRGLSLDFTDLPNLSEEGIKSLATQLQNNMKQLQFLTLVLQGLNFSDEDFQDLAIGIRCVLGNLRELKLILRNLIHVTDEGMKGLATQIEGKLSQLWKLHFAFECGRATDKGLTILARHICQNSKQLQQLTLGIAWSDEITDSGLSVVATQIGTNLRQLQELDLNFGECSGITQEGITTLKNKIKACLKQLRKFDLYPYPSFEEQDFW